MSTYLIKPSFTIKAGALIASLSCLFVSAFQGGQFVAKLATSDLERGMLFFACAALIASGQIVARLVGVLIRNQGSNGLVAAGITVCMGIAAFSIVTSTQALTRYAFEKMRVENKSSPEYLALSEEAEGYRIQKSLLSSQIIDLRRDKNNMPDNYYTKKQRIQDKISNLQNQMNQLQANINSVNSDLMQVKSSVTEKTMDAVERTTGLTPERLALLFAILLDAVPLILNLIMGYFVQEKRDAKFFEKEVASRKKHQADLRAVA